MLRLKVTPPLAFDMAEAVSKGRKMAFFGKESGTKMGVVGTLGPKMGLTTFLTLLGLLTGSLGYFVSTLGAGFSSTSSIDLTSAPHTLLGQ